MRSLSKILFASLSLGLLIVPQAFADDSITTPVARADTLYLKTGDNHCLFASNSGDQIEVTAKVITYAQRFPHSPEVHVRWGTDGGVPDTLIGQLKVQINGTISSFGVADYDYLGNPILLTAERSGHAFLPKLSGGDAAGSYDCTWTLVLDPKRSAYMVVKRSIHSGEVPKASETTEYHYDDSAW
jgi:hypothetical protein